MNQNDSKFLEALSDLISADLEEKEWLFRYFELFKTTIIWPKNLPPINRSNLLLGTLKHKFNETYWVILEENGGKLDIIVKTLVFD